MFNCLCINDLFALQRYKNFWTFLLFSLCFKALSTIYMQVGNFSKVKSACDGLVKSNISSLVSSQGLYKFSNAAFLSNPDILEIQGKGTAAKITSRIFESLPALFRLYGTSESDIQIIGLINNQRVFRWIKKEYVQPNEYLTSWNVLVPEANGSGAIGEVLSTPIIGSPIIGHTDTFLSIGQFETEAEAQACIKYVKTKFARTMLGTLKATQHNPRSTWQNVPLQDFTESSDIDWSKSIHEIDEQLYAKYGLSDNEIQFIEDKVQTMA